MPFHSLAKFNSMLHVTHSCCLVKCLYQYLPYTQVLTHPNMVPVSRATRAPVEAVKPVVRLAGVRLFGEEVTIDPVIVVVGAAVLMKLVVLVTDVCDVVASTCVSLVGLTVPLTVMVMVSRNSNGFKVLVAEQKLNHSLVIHFFWGAFCNRTILHACVQK